MGRPAQLRHRGVSVSSEREVEDAEDSPRPGSRAQQQRGGGSYQPSSPGTLSPRHARDPPWPHRLYSLLCTLLLLAVIPWRLLFSSLFLDCNHLELEPLVLRSGVPPIPPHTRPPPPPPPPTHSNATQPPPLTVDIVFVTGLPAQLQSSLRSLCYFMDTSGVGTVHLVVPDRMEGFFRDSLPMLQCAPTGVGGAPRAPLRFSVAPDSSLVPHFKDGAPYTGTVRQMTLKLAAAFTVSTPYYLVMDSDAYARRPFSVEDLFDRGGGVGGAVGLIRGRMNLDQLDFPQSPSWFAESAQLLQTHLVEDTDAFCAAQAPTEPQWFAASGNRTVPSGSSTTSSAAAAAPGTGGPFALLSPPSIAPGFLVYGACRSGRGHATHVTPALLSVALVRDVLVPRLLSSSSSTLLLRNSRATWQDVLLAFHSSVSQRCWRGYLRMGRFYSWTEYSLYFVAAVAAGALDQYHSFTSGITSFRHSIMLPELYDKADWDGIFREKEDQAPFFLVHSWFGKPLEETHKHLGRYIPTLLERGLLDTTHKEAQPSPLPLW